MRALPSARRSIVPFPQAVPLVYTVDPQACIYLTRGVCGKTFKCKDACTSEAIDLTQTEQFLEVEVGTMVVATGFDIFDPHLTPEMGYGVYPQVITTLEFERLASASGPTAGQDHPERQDAGGKVRSRWSSSNASARATGAGPLGW